MSLTCVLIHFVKFRIWCPIVADYLLKMVCNMFLCWIAFPFLKNFFFLTWTTFKVFIEFVTVMLLFFVFVFWAWGVWDLRLWPRLEPAPPALEDEVLTAGPLGKPLPLPLCQRWVDTICTGPLSGFLRCSGDFFFCPSFYQYHSLGLCSLIRSLEIGQCESSSLVL